MASTRCGGRLVTASSSTCGPCWPPKFVHIRGGGRDIHLLVDSTGLRPYGLGEWLVEKHGSSVRRSQRMLHVRVNAETGRTIAAELTAHDVDDVPHLSPLLDRFKDPTASFTAANADDQGGVYGEVATRHPEAAVVVPSLQYRAKRHG